jgi:hypothetical protein
MQPLLMALMNKTSLRGDIWLVDLNPGLGHDNSISFFYYVLLNRLAMHDFDNTDNPDFVLCVINDSVLPASQTIQPVVLSIQLYNIRHLFQMSRQKRL